MRRQLRGIAKCILRNCGHPPDKQEQTTKRAPEQDGAVAGRMPLVGGKPPALGAPGAAA